MHDHKMTKRRKTERRISVLIASVCLSVLTPAVSALAAPFQETLSGEVQDSTRCDSLTSLYKFHAMNREPGRALDFWRLVQGECPSSSEELYKDGEAMYTELFSSTGDMATLILY